MLYDPALNGVLNVAMPPDSVPEPSTFVPLRNITVPVALDGNTVALNVTCWPALDGFGIAFKEVVSLKQGLIGGLPEIVPRLFMVPTHRLLITPELVMVPVELLFMVPELRTVPELL
jgi:hypothetical protein